MSYIEKINGPDDLKKLKIDEMEVLAGEIRDAILYRDSMVGGHVGPNLGIVEVAIALHYVFNSPIDKIVWDVSHQCYPHKILTGRKDGFLTLEGMKEISGYTNPLESEHDFFKVGHTSTAVSLALGLAKARDVKGNSENVIAVLGDGSLSGGEALEGLSNGAVLGSNFILVLNDNEMSIAENHGGLYNNLRDLRESKGKAPCNMFKALGYEYLYVEEGNDLEKLIEVFLKVKDCNKPVLVHVRTLKGKGYKRAEENKERWHWNVPFDIKSGEAKFSFEGENYTEITYQYLKKKMDENKDVVLVNAGTPGIFGLTKERREEIKDRFVDVGIAEEHAVAFSSGLAKGGCKPVFMVMSSFVQRTYDQLSQDLALNENPAVVLVQWGGISNADPTHLCTFDVPLISNIPNIVYLAPTNVEEYLAMLDWAILQKEKSVVIRIPSKVMHSKKKIDSDYSKLNKFEVVKEGKDVAVIAMGNFFELGESVVDALEEKGIMATLINPRFLTGVDEELLKDLAKNHKVVITLEDGVIDGGFGEKIARFYGTYDVKVINYGAKKEFSDRVDLDVLYERYRLKKEMIVGDVVSLL